MDQKAVYKDDIFAWSLEQAAMLRRLASGRTHLPNGLDLEHVAEEIEDVGKSELRASESFLRLLLIRLLKVVSDPGAASVEQWRSEIDLFQSDFKDAVTPSIASLIDLDNVWKLAMRGASGQLAKRRKTLPPAIPTACPFRIDEIASPSFDQRAYEAKLAALVAAAALPEVNGSSSSDETNLV